MPRPPQPTSPTRSRSLPATFSPRARGWASRPPARAEAVTNPRRLSAPVSGGAAVSFGAAAISSPCASSLLWTVCIGSTPCHVLWWREFTTLPAHRKPISQGPSPGNLPSTGRLTAIPDSDSLHHPPGAGGRVIRPRGWHRYTIQGHWLQFCDSGWWHARRANMTPGGVGRGVVGRRPIGPFFSSESSSFPVRRSGMGMP